LTVSSFCLSLCRRLAALKFLLAHGCQLLALLDSEGVQLRGCLLGGLTLGGRLLALLGCLLGGLALSRLTLLGGLLGVTKGSQEASGVVLLRLGCGAFLGGLLALLGCLAFPSRFLLRCFLAGLVLDDKRCELRVLELMSHGVCYLSNASK